MAAEEGGDIITYIFTGEEERNERRRYTIPRNVTHLIMHESIEVIPQYAFYEHPNIVEVYCHAGVKRIEGWAFYGCPRLRRVIIPGAEVVRREAFKGCDALTDIECPKLERIGAMTEAKFGKKLESIGERAFLGCLSLERITFPLKNGLIASDSTFQGCTNLRRVHLVEGVLLNQSIAALQSEEWRNDMSEEVDSINQILPETPAGGQFFLNFDNLGGKAIAIREWIERVLRKVIDYKAQHHQLLNGVATTLKHADLPNDIVMRNVLPFLELPSHRFEGEEEVEG